jgi:hypothetical protein
MPYSGKKETDIAGAVASMTESDLSRRSLARRRRRARRLGVQSDVGKLGLFRQVFVAETTIREANIPIWGNHLVAGLGLRFV